MHCAYKYCKKKHPFPQAYVHVFQIVKRGEPFSGNQFCSMECAENFVKEIPPGDWEIRSEYFETTTLMGQPDPVVCVHVLEVAEIKKKGFKTESSEMGKGAS